MELFYKICLVLVIIGGINWGLIGFFSFDLVGWLCGGSASMISRVIFSVVGIASLGAIPILFSSIGGDQ